MTPAPDEQKSIGDVHAALIAEADAQAKFNADSNALQVAQNQAFQDKLKNAVPAPIAPDDARAEALAAQKALLDAASSPAPAAPAETTEPTAPPAPVTEEHPQQ